MKKIFLLLLLLIGLRVSAQQTYWTPGIPTSSTSFSPTWRYNGTDSLANIYLSNGNKWSLFYSAAQSNLRYLKKSDSVLFTTPYSIFHENNTYYGSNILTGIQVNNNTSNAIFAMNLGTGFTGRFLNPSSSSNYLQLSWNGLSSQYGGNNVFGIDTYTSSQTRFYGTQPIIFQTETEVPNPINSQDAVNLGYLQGNYEVLSNKVPSLDSTSSHYLNTAGLSTSLDAKMAQYNLGTANTGSLSPLSLTFTQYQHTRITGLINPNLVISNYSTQRDFYNLAKFVSFNYGATVAKSTVENGMTLTTTGTGQGGIYLSEFLKGGFGCMEITIDSTYSTGGTYFNLEYGIVKPGAPVFTMLASNLGSNFTGISSNNTAFTSAGETDQANANTVSILTGSKIKLYFFLNGAWINSLVVYGKDNYVYGTPYNISSLVNTTDSTFFKNWKFGVAINSNTTTASVHISSIRSGYWAGLGIADYSFVTNQHGIPYIKNNHAVFTASLHGWGTTTNWDGGEVSVNDLDLATKQIKQIGIIFNQSGPKVVGGYVSQIVYNDKTNQFLYLAPNLGDSVTYPTANFDTIKSNFIQTNDNLLGGIHVLKNTVHIDPDPGKGNIDPALFFNESDQYWYLAHSVQTPTTEYFEISKTQNFTTWTTVFTDVSGVQQEGAKIIRIGGTPYFITTTRVGLYYIYSTQGTLIGTISSPLTTNPGGHPAILATESNGQTNYWLLTMDTQKYPAVNSAGWYGYGDTYLYKADQTYNAYEYPLIEPVRGINTPTTVALPDLPQTFTDIVNKYNVWHFGNTTNTNYTNYSDALRTMDNATNLTSLTANQRIVGNFYGIWTPTAYDASSVYFGVQGTTQKEGSFQANKMVGVASLGLNFGSGNINEWDGLTSYFSNQGSGTLATLYNVKIASPLATNPITTAYGLLIATQKVSGVTTGHGIWQQGASDDNYFAGNVGIGTSGSGNTLDVRNAATTLTTNQTLLNVTNNGQSYNTTSGAITNYTVKFINNAAISSGANNLINYGALFTATGGTAAFGFQAPAVNFTEASTPAIAQTGNFWNSGGSPKWADHSGGVHILAYTDNPIFITPTLGAATATSINKVAITAPATSATLTIANGKTFTVNNSLTLAGIDGTTETFLGASGTIPVIVGNGLNVSLNTTSTAIANHTPSSSTGSQYVINWSLSCKTSSTPTLTLTYTDPNAGAQTITLYNTPMTTNTVASGNYVIVATSGSMVSLTGSDGLALGDIFASATIKKEQ